MNKIFLGRITPEWTHFHITHVDSGLVFTLSEGEWVELGQFQAGYENRVPKKELARAIEHVNRVRPEGRIRVTAFTDEADFEDTLRRARYCEIALQDGKFVTLGKVRKPAHEHIVKNLDCSECQKIGARAIRKGKVGR